MFLQTEINVVRRLTPLPNRKDSQAILNNPYKCGFPVTLNLFLRAERKIARRLYADD